MPADIGSWNGEKQIEQRRFSEVANKSIWAKTFLKTERRSCLATTLNVGAGGGETERPRGHCWSPEEIEEPGGWKETPSNVRSPGPRS